MVNDWLVQPAKYGGMGDGNAELYMPDKFLPCWNELYGNETEQDFRRGRPYCYVPDELKCKTFDFKDDVFNRHRLDRYADHVAYKRPSIELSELTHFTNTYGFNMIESDDVIEALPKYLDDKVTGRGKRMDYSFVWFTATVGSDGAEIIRESIERRRREIHHFLHYDTNRQTQFNFMADENNYATSTPFTLRNHPCGDHGFSFDTKRLIKTYCRSVFPHRRTKYECRSMGTFIYKKEVMFAVVIHPAKYDLGSSERSFFQKFPALDQDDDDAATVVYEEDDGRIYWKPFSTSAKFAGSHNPVFCRWDQVAFAFYFPNNRIGFDLYEMEGKYSTF